MHYSSVGEGTKGARVSAGARVAAEETSQDVANPAAAAGRGGANDRNPLGLDRDTLAVLDRSKSKSKSKSTRQRGDDVRTKIVL